MVRCWTVLILLPDDFESLRRRKKQLFSTNAAGFPAFTVIWSPGNSMNCKKNPLCTQVRQNNISGVRLCTCFAFVGGNLLEADDCWPRYEGINTLAELTREMLVNRRSVCNRVDVYVFHQWWIDCEMLAISWSGVVKDTIHTSNNCRAFASRSQE